MTITARKLVYLFEEGDASKRDLLGGKGAGLAEMTRAGLPVPPGFTITTEACRAYYGPFNHTIPDELWTQVLDGLQEVEQRARKKLGDADNPLLVSVRSGAKFSMPGMMDTVLNLGLNDETVQGLARQTSNERFAYDAYRRFIQMFGKVVLGIDNDLFEEALSGAKQSKGVRFDTELDADDLRELVQTFKDLTSQHCGRSFPEDPLVQLRMAIEAVFHSWNNDRAIAYRNLMRIPNDLGMEVSVFEMVFGNLG